MNTKIEKSEKSTIVSLDGSLDTVNSTLFMKEIEPILTQEGLDVVVDCEKLTYISSSGLRTFKILHKSIQENSGTMVVCNLRPEVYKIFELTGFTKIMTINK